MKLKKCMKRISAVILAATMLVTVMPNQPVVKADADDFPDEILFPVSILDFPADNLFFECPMNWFGGYDSYLDLTSQNIPGVNTGGEKGKMLVADHLESDPTSIYYRLPVYKEETVDYIARRVLATLNDATNKDLAFNKQYVDGKLNPICMKNYIRKKDWKVINAEDGALENGAKLGSKDSCLKGDYVGYLGGPSNGSVTLKYDATFAGIHDVRIFYMSGENRDLYITVNGTVNGPFTCNNHDWNNPGETPYEAKVSGFIVGSNTIVLSGKNPGGTDTWAPDVDRIEIQNVNAAAPDPVDPNELFTEEAENGKITIGDGGGDGYGNIVANKAPGEKYSKGYAHIDWWNWNNGDGVLSNGNSYESGKFNLPAGLDAGNYDIKVYYTRWTSNYAGFVVNNNSEQGKDPTAENDDPTKRPFVISNVYLNKNDNVIRFRGDRTNLDRFVICKAGTADASLADPTGYPLGTYAESKAKYNIDEDGDKISDNGWYDIETCYDYAYFITANLFKYHPTMNTAYGNYNNLVFHRVTQNGKNYYEFMADQIHDETIHENDWWDNGDHKGYKTRINEVYAKLGSSASDAERKADLARYSSIKNGAGRLIYNPDTRSIRNACDANGNYVGPKGNEYETTSGSMFVCDGDAYNKDSTNHIAGEGIKRYPKLDPPKKADDGKNHNFNYTIRTHSRFVYKEGADQKFFFSGDDDVYVFVNGNLLVDLGGQHQQLDGSFNLDALASDPKYGLVNGKAVDFDFFYMERHSTASNFWGKMSFKLKNDEVELQWPDEFDTLTEMAIPYGYVVDLNYKFSSMRELTTNKFIQFSDEIGDSIGWKEFKLADEVKLSPYKDPVTGNPTGEYAMTATVHRMQPDGTIKDEVTVFKFANDHDFTAAEAAKVTEFFTKLELEQDDSVEISGVVYDTARKKFSDFAATDDSMVRQLTFETTAEYKAYMTMGGTNTVEDTVAIDSKVKDTVTVKVRIGALFVSCKVEGLGDNFEIKDDLTSFGHFTIKRLDSEDDSATPDVDERVVYENAYALKNGGTTIVFDAVKHPEYDESKTIYRDPLPKGTYEMTLDTQKLTGYDLFAEIWVKDKGDTEKKLKYVVSRTTKMKMDQCKVVSYDQIKYPEGKFSLDSIQVDLEPWIQDGQWQYPEVEYILKAYRKVNPLKDMT